MTWDVKALKKALLGIDPEAAEGTLSRLPRWKAPVPGQSVGLVGGIGHGPTHKRPPPRSSGGRRTPKKGAP